MDLLTHVTYARLPDGGAQVTFTNAAGSIAVPFDHDQALGAAGRILAAAGVREFTFTGDGDGGGRIREGQS